MVTLLSVISGRDWRRGKYSKTMKCEQQLFHGKLFSVSFSFKNTDFGHRRLTYLYNFCMYLGVDNLHIQCHCNTLNCTFPNKMSESRFFLKAEIYEGK